MNYFTAIEYFDWRCWSSFLLFSGLLWNLSSVDTLKPELLKSALGVLLDRVILPYTTAFNQETNNSKSPEVFLHTTGCLK